MSRASVGEVRAVISLVEDDEIQLKLVEALRKVAPNIPILGATSELKRLEKYFELGIETAFIKEARTAELLFDALLPVLGYTEPAVNGMKERIFREEKPTFFPRGIEQISPSPLLAGADSSVAGALH